MVRTISEIDQMEGHAFEEQCAQILSYNGFSAVEVTQASGDFGTDITAYKDGQKYGIQCKRYSNSVGVKAVQEAISGAAFYKCDIPAVLTNSKFTPQAKKMAAKTNVQLWDRHQLEQFIRIAQPQDAEAQHAIREELRRKSEEEQRRKRKSYNNLTAALLILTLWVGLIPLWASKWKMKRKLEITAALAVLAITVQLFPQICLVVYITHIIMVIAFCKSENRSDKVD